VLAALSRRGGPHRQRLFRAGACTRHRADGRKPRFEPKRWTRFAGRQGPRHADTRGGRWGLLHSAPARWSRPTDGGVKPITAPLLPLLQEGTAGSAIGRARVGPFALLMGPTRQARNWAQAHQGKYTRIGACPPLEAGLEGASRFHHSLPLWLGEKADRTPWSRWGPWHFLGAPLRGADPRTPRRQERFHRGLANRPPHPAPSLCWRCRGSLLWAQRQGHFRCYVPDDGADGGHPFFGLGPSRLRAGQQFASCNSLG